jgi:hypothetical protein
MENRMPINVLILAATRPNFSDEDGGYPLCLFEIDGESLLQKIISNTGELAGARYAYAFLKQDVEKYHLDRIAALLTPDCQVIKIPEGTKGSACTALLAACALDPDAELLILSANEFLDVNYALELAKLRDQGCDAGTFIFKSIHPRYSYVSLNSEGNVIEAAQQKPISNNATAGVFWFRKTDAFIEATKLTIKKGASTDNKFYIAPILNELILDQKHIRAIAIDNARYHPLKTLKQSKEIPQPGHFGHAD